MKGLALFTRTNSPGHWNLASWHPPQSMTWRWILSFSRFRADEWRAWPIWMPYRANNGLQWTVRIPFVGFLRFSQQRPMWYRDLYQSKRDELDAEIEQRKQMQPPRRSPFKPTVIDGDQLSTERQQLRRLVMKARMQSTDRVVAINAVGFEGKTQARVWEGVTEAGVPFTAYIPLVQVHKNDDNGHFQRELTEHKQPTFDTERAIDARVII